MVLPPLEAAWFVTASMFIFCKSLFTALFASSGTEFIACSFGRTSPYPLPLPPSYEISTEVVVPLTVVVSAAGFGASAGVTGSVAFGASVGFASTAFAGSVGLVSFATLSDSALLNSFLTSSTVFFISSMSVSKPCFNLSKKPFSPSIAACSIFAETSLVSTSFSCAVVSFSLVSFMVFSSFLMSSLMNSLISLSRSVAFASPSPPAFSNCLAFSSSARLVL